jgi:hypothetical protein
MDTNQIATSLKNWAQEELRIKQAQEANEKLKKTIEFAVLEEGIELRLPEGPKCIITSKGSYNWMYIALQLEPDEEIIKKHTTTAWNKVAEEVGTSNPVALNLIKEQHYIPGEKFAQCRLK